MKTQLNTEMIKSQTSEDTRNRMRTHQFLNNGKMASVPAKGLQTRLAKAGQGYGKDSEEISGISRIPYILLQP